MGGRLVLRVDDFGQAGAEAAVVVDAGVAEVLVRKGDEAIRGCRWGEGAGLDLGEEIEEGGFVHFGLLVR